MENCKILQMHRHGNIYTRKTNSLSLHKKVQNQEAIHVQWAHRHKRFTKIEIPGSILLENRIKITLEKNWKRGKVNNDSQAGNFLVKAPSYSL